MFTVLAIAFSLLFLIAILGVPFCKASWARKAGGAVQRRLVSGCRSVRFYEDRSDNEPSLFWMRIWGAGGAGLFAILGHVKGDLFFDHPFSIAETAAFALVAAAGSGFVVMTVLAVMTFLERSRAHAALKRCGIKSLWTVDGQKQPADLKELVTARVLDGKLVCVLDVTGQAMMGEGANTGTGLLYDALAHAQNVPVFLLLLNPNSTNVDPDSKVLTVGQEVLSKMGISDTMYRRRLRATLDLVKDLNEKRPPEGKIGVRFYKEKPTVRTVLFENCALVSPWTAQELEGTYVLFEAGPATSPASFFEVYRTQFMRLWRGATAVAEMPEPKLPSKVVRKKDAVPEQRMALSATKAAAATTVAAAASAAAAAAEAPVSTPAA